MATKTQVKKFIETLSALAIAEAKKRSKWVLPSVCIAQAALETGWGTASLMTKANAYFGIKATPSWKGKVYSAKTRECYDGVKYTNITALFRAYDSLEDSVADYYDLITGLNRYAGAVNNPDATATITAIKKGGYATSPTYINKVMGIIKTYNLTQYDNFATADTDDVIVVIEEGNKVRVNKGAKTYTGGKLASFVYQLTYDVIDVERDRVVIGRGKKVTAAVNRKDLTLV